METFYCLFLFSFYLFVFICFFLSFLIVASVFLSFLEFFKTFRPLTYPRFVPFYSFLLLLFLSFSSSILHSLSLLFFFSLLPFLLSLSLSLSLLAIPPLHVLLVSFLSFSFSLSSSTHPSFLLSLFPASSPCLSFFLSSCIHTFSLLSFVSLLPFLFSFLFSLSLSLSLSLLMTPFSSLSLSSLFFPLLELVSWHNNVDAREAREKKKITTPYMAGQVHSAIFPSFQATRTSSTHSSPSISIHSSRHFTTAPHTSRLLWNYLLVSAGV